MQTLPPEAQHRVNASKGWLELNNHVEANRELDRIAPSLRVHPDVLETRWRIYGKMKWWSAALEMASAICELAPERASGWLLRAHSLHQLQRTDRAWDLLTTVVERFPNVATIPYYLACYGCHLERKEEAWSWLERAMDRGGVTKIAQMALTESDLKLLWTQIASKLTDLKAVVDLAQSDLADTADGATGTKVFAEGFGSTRNYSLRAYSSGQEQSLPRFEIS
jgi:hypothetical protein